MVSTSVCATLAFGLKEVFVVRSVSQGSFLFSFYNLLISLSLDLLGFFCFFFSNLDIQISDLISIARLGRGWSTQNISDQRSGRIRGTGGGFGLGFGCQYLPPIRPVATDPSCCHH